MKFCIALLVSLAAFTAHAGSADCTLDPKGLKSAIDVTDKSQYLKLSPVKSSQGNLSQSGVLQSGVPIKYAVGGCEHYGYSFEYKYKNLLKQVDSVIPGNDKNKYKNLMINLTLELLSQTSTTEDGTNEKDILVRSLREAQANEALEPVFSTPNDVLYEFSCGDATCQVRATNKKLTTGYSMPL